MHGLATCINHQFTQIFEIKICWVNGFSQNEQLSNFLSQIFTASKGSKWQGGQKVTTNDPGLMGWWNRFGRSADPKLTPGSKPSHLSATCNQSMVGI
jgi:hypothetical protein